MKSNNSSQIARIEISSDIDAKAEQIKKQLNSEGFIINDIKRREVHTIDSVLSESSDEILKLLCNPVIQKGVIASSSQDSTFDWAVEIGYLPGVTDNVSTTTKQCIEDCLGKSFSEDEDVYSSQLYLLSGKGLQKDDVKRISELLHNPLIQSSRIKSYSEFCKDNGMGILIPKVRLDAKPAVNIVDLLNASDEELAVIGKRGIADYDIGDKSKVISRRGPLALDLIYMKAIQAYFRKKGRNPTDVELESIAQTWSEHCKHTIFADLIDDIDEGIFRRYIRGATEKIIANRKRASLDEFCVSVFTDNSGAILFDTINGIDYLITHKVETHNSPSALDPFGGAITGIVGVNRDAMGFGLGAKPIVNVYGFFVGLPHDARPIFREKEKSGKLRQRMFSPRRHLDGITEGVNVGGNCSGIPTDQGCVYFHYRYKGKPLVFVGTVGLIPARLHTPEGIIKSYEKCARPGDYIIMLGGRVGKDGIHGATFSSEEMDSGSPATAVQIGDPITQKKMSDALMEIREKGWYSSITDNGAGGLSCSVAEMAKESGGYLMNLSKVPVKYPGLAPWEINVSESQERMTLSVNNQTWKPFSEHMISRGVEATIIGEFTDSGRAVIIYDGAAVMDLDMNFLHDGLPKKHRTTKRPDIANKRMCYQEPAEPKEYTKTLLEILARPNIASFEFISQQYDHEVQGTSVIKPLQGKGRVNGDATIVRPLFESEKGIVLSQAAYPSYSELDPYRMAAASIDTAIRNAICAGANPKKIALLDNFCWCSSDEPERLWQLKEAARACYDYSIMFDAPFISGKDSMFNDFKGFDESGNPIKISIPPTLLISSIGIIDDIGKAVTIDAKMPGDLVYVIGNSCSELGGSEYLRMVSEKPEVEHPDYPHNYPVPNVDKSSVRKYAAINDAIEKEVIASAISVGRGGLAVALAKTAMAGKLGLEADFEENDIYNCDSFHSLLYSESQGRIIVTISPNDKDRFEGILAKRSVDEYCLLGKISEDDFIVKSYSREIINIPVNKLLESYKSTFKNF